MMGDSLLSVINQMQIALIESEESGCAPSKDLLVESLAQLKQIKDVLHGNIAAKDMMDLEESEEDTDPLGGTAEVQDVEAEKVENASESTPELPAIQADIKDDNDSTAPSAASKDVEKDDAQAPAADDDTGDSSVLAKAPAPDATTEAKKLEKKVQKKRTKVSLSLLFDEKDTEDELFGGGGFLGKPANGKKTSGTGLFGDEDSDDDGLGGITQTPKKTPSPFD